MDIFFIIFGFVLSVCWIILPLALIGTKPLLRRLIEEQERTNELLARVVVAVRNKSPQ